MSLARKVIGNIYLSFMWKKAFAKLNNRILEVALRCRGYSNFRDHYESGEHYFIEHILSSIKPKVCVDVGANVGSYAQALLEATQAKVYSFEPLSQPFKSLSAVGKLYPERLMAINHGVGAKDEVLIIHFSDEATAHASFSEEVKNVSYVRNEKSQEIDVVSLDSYFTKYPVDQIDFIKIDTEGFEYEVLQGAQLLISQYQPKLIQIEYNWHQLFKGQTLFAFSNLLRGYTPFQMLADRLEKRDPKDSLSNVYQFSNFVFVRNDLESLITQ